LKLVRPSNALIYAAFLLLFTAVLPAQEAAVDEVETEDESFISEAVALAVETADYYELVAWCRRLELSERGSVEDLRGRLFTYFDTEPSVREKETRRSISIESARSTEYFTLTEIDERYVVIEGDVYIVLEDPDRRSTHMIRADRVVFNQDTNQMSAEGGVEYTLEEQDRTDVFRGDKLTFDIDTWEGIFFQGYSEAERNIEGERITFRFFGEDIRRSKENIITLEKGYITSSKPEDPYYQVKAKKIWILAPGEWAIVNASLYVGHIPVFYIPFFFKNGDKIFFNPAMGFSSEKGFFMQTTTYFLGRKEETEEPMSFLQLGEEEDEQITEIRGLYLREDKNITPAERRRYEYALSSGAYGKILLDLYSRLGLFGGVDINLKELSVLREAAIFAGVARSRDVYISPETGWYTPFWELASGSVTGRWNDGFLFSTLVPFRYGFVLTLELQHDVFDLEADFAYYSDPYFRRDFLDRDEEIPWGEFLGFTEGGVSIGGESEDVSRLSWGLTSRVRIPTQKSKPYLSTAAITNLKTNLTWKTKETDTTGTAGLDPALPGYVPESNRTAYSFPLKRFFYPDSFLLPAASAEISGNLFDTARSRDRRQEKAGLSDEFPEKPPGKGFIPPQAAVPEKAVETEEVYAPPRRRPDAELPRKPTGRPYTHSLGYRILPGIDLDSRFSSEDWSKPNEVDYGIEYSLLNTRGDLSFTYSGKIYENFFTYSDTISLSGQFRSHFNRGTGVGDETWESFLTSDYENTELEVTNTFDLKTMPFSAGWYLEKSYISYTLGTVLLKRDFIYVDPENVPVYHNLFTRWTKEFISEHQTEFVLLPEFFGNEQRFSLRYTLPPLDQEFAWETVLTTGPLVSKLNWEFGEYPSDPSSPATSPRIWEPRPVRLLETLTLGNFLTLKQLFSFSLKYVRFKSSETVVEASFLEGNLGGTQKLIFGVPDEDELPGTPFFYGNPYEWTSILDVWWFHVQYTMRRAFPYTFDTSQGWIQGAGEIFQPERFKAWIDYSRDFEPMWKNRIRMSLDFSTVWNMDLIRFTESTWTFNLGFTFEIHKFLDLSISLSSENRDVFRYFPLYADTVGVDHVNIITDLLKSVNVFNTRHRRESFFNAKRATIKAVHDMRDWDLTFEYVGEPILTTDPTGFKFYEWTSSISIFLKWSPIPEIKREVVYESKEWSY
jgi:hypothetical protein